MFNIKQKYSLLIKAFIFILLVVLLDFTLGYGLKKIYFAQTSGLYARTTYSLNKTNEEIIILGASTANRQYNPVIFEDKTGLTSYNTGRDGQGLFYFLSIQESILARYKPKVFILDIYFNSLNVGRNDYDRLDALLPYYKDNDNISSIIDLRKKYDNIKVQSNIYPYNSMVVTMMSNYCKNSIEIDNGFHPVTKNIKSLVKENFEVKNNSIDTLKVFALNKIIDNCRVNNIKLLVVRPPYYVNNFIKTKSLLLLEDILKSNSINYLDLSDYNIIVEYSKCDLVKIMADQAHLNKLGADYYSYMVADYFNNTMNN